MPTSILQFQRDGNRLLASYIQGAERVDSHPFSDAGLLEKWAGDYVEIMEKALAFPLNDHRDTLEDFGRCLFDNLMTGDLAEFIREELEGTRAILVDMPESLLWLPVEVMFDGEEFLGTRHALGRRITAWEGGRARRLRARMDGRERPAFLLVAGHAEDEAFFDETRNEIYDLCAAIEECDTFEMRELLVSNSIERPELLRALSSADFVHFSGHSDAGPEGRAGWLFETFRLSPRDISELNGCDPYLVFSNSCRSSAVSNWREVRDMVRAFWEQGTQHFIGANTRIHYKRAAEFAEAFYKHFLRGETIGESMRQARLSVLNNPAHHDACWLSYVLYGDPRFRLAEPTPSGGYRVSEALAQRASEPRTRSAPSRPAPEPQPVAAAPAPPPRAPAPEAPPVCSWTGKPMLSRIGAGQCAHPGCGNLLSMEAQMEQRRLRMDQAIHVGRPAGGGLASRAIFCPEHLPEDLKDWMNQTQKAAMVVQGREAVCAWTGRAASRSEVLGNAFKETPHGLASPEAVEKYTCPNTGEMIAPNLAKEDRGFIEWRGRNYSEEGYWRALGCADAKAIDEERARAAEKRSRQAMAERLAGAENFSVGFKKYASIEVAELYDLATVAAWSLKLSAGMLRGSRPVGLIQRPVLHQKHFQRFGRDRQPATLGDLERAAREFDPLPGHPESLFILSSPTGWSGQARDHARELQPGESTLILRHSANRGEPLAFNRRSELAEALKIDLAGGAGLA